MRSHGRFNQNTKPIMLVTREHEMHDMVTFSAIIRTLVRRWRIGGGGDGAWPSKHDGEQMAGIMELSWIA